MQTRPIVPASGEGSGSTTKGVAILGILSVRSFSLLVVLRFPPLTSMTRDGLSGACANTDMGFIGRWTICARNVRSFRLYPLRASVRERRYRRYLQE